MARIGTQQLVQLCRRSGQALRAGVDSRTIWQQESRRGAPSQRHHLAMISQRVERGDTVAEAMSATNGFFPPLVCELVDVGEQTGKLDDVLLRLADHYQHLLSLRRQFLIGIAWPSIQLAAAIVIVGFVIWIMGVITPANNEPVRIFGLAGTSGLLIYALVVGLVAALIATTVFAVARGWLGPTPMIVATRIPVLGQCVQTMALARFSWSLAMALDSGIDARRGMGLALRSTQNSYFSSHAETIDAVLLRGGEFHESLRRTRAFPAEFLDALENAELSGTQSESMARLAEEYQERAKTASRILTVIAAFLTWAAVAAVIVAVIFQFFFTVIFPPYREALQFLEDSQ